MKVTLFSRWSATARVAAFAACVGTISTAGHAFAESSGSLAFRCSLEGGTFQVRVKDGLVAFGESENFRKIKVTVATNLEGDATTYTFHDANIIDGVPHAVTLVIGADLNPDSVVSDGDIFRCKFKATINTALLRSLVNSQ